MEIPAVWVENMVKHLLMPLQAECCREVEHVQTLERPPSNTRPSVNLRRFLSLGLARGDPTTKVIYCQHFAFCFVYDPRQFY